MAKAEDEQKKMAEQYEKTKESLDAMEKKYKLLEERCVMLDREKDTLKGELMASIISWSLLSSAKIFKYC